MKLQTGAWAVVVMNADASPRVAVNLQAGFRSDLLQPLGIGLLVGGGVLLLIGVPLILMGSLGLGRRLQASNSIGPGGPTDGGWPGAGGWGQTPGPMRSGAPTAWRGVPPDTGPGVPTVGPGVPPDTGAAVVPPAGWGRYPATLNGGLDP